VREPIELSFGAVSGVGPGIHVLDGVHVPQKEGAILGDFSAFAPSGLNGQNVGIFRTEMYSTRT